MSSFSSKVPRVFAALGLFPALLALGACRQAPAETPLIDRSQARSTIRKSLNRQLKLKVLSLTKFPSGPAYEVKQVGGPGYFVVDAQAGEVDYAILEDIKEKEGAARFDLRQAQSIARKWAQRQRAFADFRYLEKQADYQWPKFGYYTAVWAGRSPARNRNEFAKVTVDLATGKVVSFGMGDPKWTMFCLPAGPLGSGKARAVSP